MNLCTNACHAMRETGGRITVGLDEVELRFGEAVLGPDLPPGRYACLSVSDTGCGMNEAEMERIFEPYYSTREPGEGTGLGLAMVAGIRRNHRGACRVEGAPGRGATFRGYLPLLAGKETVGAGGPDMPRILIVDDDEQVRTMLRATLERAGYEVEEAADGRGAIALYRRSPVDVVLADIIMPEMEGIETILRLRREHPDVKIIAMSGGGHIGPQSYLASARQCGAQVAFTKPIDRQELLAALRRMAA